MMRQQPDWARIAMFSALTSVVVAAVIFFALPDHRWIAFVVAGLGVLEALFMARVMPFLTRANTSDELAEMNATAEAEAEILDGDWGVAPPSEPAARDED